MKYLLEGVINIRAEVILGVNIDTAKWITKLKNNGAQYILVIDYDSLKKENLEEEIVYLSPEYASEYLKQFNSINFYKSLYAFPGMSGKMSDLHKRRDD